MIRLHLIDADPRVANALAKTIAFAALLSTACSTTTYWRHPSPAQNFKKDDYECSRENTHPAMRPPGGGVTGERQLDAEGWMACVEARGWYRVADPATSGRAGTAVDGGGK